MKLSRKQIESLIDNTSLDHKGKNLYGRCPKCSQMEFGISLEENHLFQCFRGSKCGFKGNIFTLLKHLGKLREFLTEHEINIFERMEINFTTEEKEIDLTLPEITIPFGWKRTYDDPYLRERGFTDQQFKKFEVGRSKFKKDYVTFLIRNSNKLVGYVSRSERKKEWIDEYNKKQKEEGSNLVYLRYDNSDTEFSKTLFGIDEVIQGTTEDVILVEGIFSKTKTDRNLALDSYKEMKCCATFGAKFSDEQIELLKRKGVKNLFFWFEADVLNKIKPIVSKAASYFNVRVSYLEGCDPGDINSEQAFYLLEKSKNWLDFNTSYMSINLK